MTKEFIVGSQFKYIKVVFKVKKKNKKIERIENMKFL